MDLYGIIRFIMTVCLLWLYAYLLFRQCALKHHPLIVLGLECGTIILISDLITLHPLVRIALFFCAAFMFIFTQFNIKPNAVLFHSAFMTIIANTCGYMSDALFKAILADRELNPILEPIGSIILTGIFTLYVILIVYYMSNRGTMNRQDNYSSSTFLIIIPFMFFLMLIYAIDAPGGGSPLNNNPLILAIVCLLTIVSDIIIFYYDMKIRRTLTEAARLQLSEQNGRLLLDYYKSIQDSNEQRRIMIHDYRKHFTALQLLMKDKQYDKAEKYIGEQIGELEAMSPVRVCDNEMLNAILTRYKNICNENNVKLYLDIRSRVFSDFSDSDLTSLFANLLDNAINAARGMENAFIDVAAEKLEDTDNIRLLLSNSCREEPDLERAKNRTDGHGVGLVSIRKIVKKYNGKMDMYFKEEDSSFHTIILLQGNRQTS